MAARPRTIRKRGFPANLYESNGYYQWKHPITGQWFGLGRDKAKAFREATEANIAVAGELQNTRLIHRISGEAERTFSAFVPIYEQSLDKRKLAATTLRWRKQRLAKIADKLGDYMIAEITTLQISEILDEIEREAIAKGGNGRIAQVNRSELMDFFREAQAKGWVDANPVAVTRAAVVEVQTERLTLDAFKTIYKKALKLEPWVANSMALALVTGQRREDVSKFEFRRHISDGFLLVDQGKTGTKIKIPLTLRLDALDWTVGGVIEQCRDSALSRYMIHSSKKHAKAEVGGKLHPSTISAGFAKARDMSGLKWTGVPPNFREIRSLSERLYAAQGVDTQTLLGHKSKDMTAVYHDVRGAEWLEVKA